MQLRLPTSRRVYYVAAGSILIAYLLVALAPYRWNPPRRVKNGAVRTERGSVLFSSPGITRTGVAPGWLEPAIRESSLTVRLRARSFSADQSGPARLFSVSKTSGLRNFTIAQEGKALVVRLRTPATDLNGLPEIAVPAVFDSSQWRDIEVTVNSGSLVVLVDGQGTVEQDLPESPFQNWDHGFPLVLGNELTLNRPWLGEIAVAEVQVGEQRWEYLSPAAMEAPPFLSNGRKFQWLSPGLDQLRLAHATDRPWIPFVTMLTDAVLNLVCFVPFGLSVAMLKIMRWTNAAIFCAMVSLSVETAQFFFDMRMPSFSDWLTNSLGALIGAFCASRIQVCNAAVSS